MKGPPLFIVAVLLLVILQLIIPKRYAFAPIIIACFHLGDIEFVPQLTPVRLMIVVGLMRATFSGSLVIKPQNALDKIFFVFSTFAILVSLAPRLDIPSPLNQNLGIILNVHGTYIYGRSLLSGADIIDRFSKAIILISIPLGALLFLEHKTGKNYYSPLGSRSSSSMERLGKNRALGPFQHAILSGTTGAVVIPFGIYMWRRKKLYSLSGIGAGTAAVIASASSGPMAAAIATCGSIFIWKFRKHLSLIQKTGLTAAIIAHIVSSRGIWYLMAQMDLSGGSTGYHRARLIDSAISDFWSWWLFGTDYTRDWMFSGVSWSDRHTDITNQYLQYAVTGGLPLMLSFIAILLISYKFYGKRLRGSNFKPDHINFGIWCIGSALVAHTVSFMSVSYFDQSYATVSLLASLAPAVALIEIENEIDPTTNK